MLCFSRARFFVPSPCSLRFSVAAKFSRRTFALLPLPIPALTPAPALFWLLGCALCGLPPLGRPHRRNGVAVMFRFRCAVAVHAHPTPYHRVGYHMVLNSGTKQVLALVLLFFFRFVHFAWLRSIVRVVPSSCSPSLATYQQWKQVRPPPPPFSPSPRPCSRFPC